MAGGRHSPVLIARRLSDLLQGLTGTAGAACCEFTDNDQEMISFCGGPELGRLRRWARAIQVMDRPPQPAATRATSIWLGRAGEREQDQAPA